MDEHPVATPAAERHIGGDGTFLTYGRGQRESMTDIIDTLPEIDSGAFEAIPVLEMATPIESTRQALPQLFGLGGQTGHLQAKSEMKQGDRAATTRRVMSKVQLGIMMMKRESLKKDTEVAKQMSFVMSSLNSTRSSS